MTVWQAVLLGLVQGLTEFLPVSSSGHLVISQKLLGVAGSIPFDLVVHLATVLAIVIYFHRELWEMVVAFWFGSLECFKLLKSEKYVLGEHFRISWLIIIGTIPAVLIGIAFKDWFETFFSSTYAVGIFLLVTGAVIFIAEYFANPSRREGVVPESPSEPGRAVPAAKLARDEFQLNFLDAILIGCAQGCAIAPGLSRSGVTIATGLLRGLKRDLAARFSFYLAIPVVLGAGVFKFADVLEAGSGGIGVGTLLWGFLAALASGLLAIKFLMAMIRRTSLNFFAVYCIVVGVLVVGFLH